jgi:hypothetical protein
MTAHGYNDHGRAQFSARHSTILHEAWEHTQVAAKTIASEYYFKGHKDGRETAKKVFEPVTLRLEGLIIESDEESQLAAAGSLTKKDYKRLAHAHLKLLVWIQEWLDSYSQDRLMNPPDQKQPQPAPVSKMRFLKDSAFQWSSFTDEFFRHGSDFPRERSEYWSAQEADEKIKYEDGEIAFDTPENIPTQKMLFGIYGYFVEGKGWELSAHLWNVHMPGLIGCATIKDWEWERYADATAGSFTIEKVHSRLQSEVKALAHRLNSY